jgi:hypothetical protein
MTEYKPPPPLSEVLRDMRAKHWLDIAEAARCHTEPNERDEARRNLQIEFITGLTTIQLTDKQQERIWRILESDPYGMLPNDVFQVDSPEPPPKPDGESPLSPETEPQQDHEPEKPCRDVQKDLF